MGLFILNQLPDLQQFRLVADRFMKRAASGKIDTNAVVDQLERFPGVPHRQLFKAAQRSGMDHLEFLARLRQLVENGAYGDNQMRCIGARFREHIDPRWTRPEILALKEELAQLLDAA